MSFVASFKYLPLAQYRCREGALVDVLQELDELKEATGRIGTSERGEVRGGGRGQSGRG